MFKREEPPKGYALMSRVKVRIGAGDRARLVEGEIRARWYIATRGGWMYSIKPTWLRHEFIEVRHADITLLSAEVVKFDPQSRATPRVPGARYATAIARPA